MKNYHERFKNQAIEKSNGVVYTPSILAEKLSSEMLSCYRNELPPDIAILDPAVGEGELLNSLILNLKKARPGATIRAVGYDIDKQSCEICRTRLSNTFTDVEIDVREGDFLTEVDSITERFDFIIANPPYIRTQTLGHYKVKELMEKFGVSGRVDIYYFFLMTASRVLQDCGVAGYITSNKFLSIKAGESLRKFMVENYRIWSIKDYGDTKVFSNASVLPCTVVFSKGRTESADSVKFTSLYESHLNCNALQCESIYEHLDDDGMFRLPDQRVVSVKQGFLRWCPPGGIWSQRCKDTDQWLENVERNTWQVLSDIGKVKVGIKTTADNVFIGDNWGSDCDAPELLRPLITHRDAGKIVAGTNCNWRVLYTHEEIDGKRSVVNLESYPKSRKYLEKHRVQLSGRKYVEDAGRMWYEIWVPQKPSSWQHKKIVFRDICETPQFWLDESGAVVNGDCYWIDVKPTVPDDVVYLALAVANSTFIEKYYDLKFNTKLYSGKRRFMAQYVEQFPLPCTNTVTSQQAIKLVRQIVNRDLPANKNELNKLDALVEEMFMAH